MKKFTVLEGLAAVLADINIDTDAIIPKQFLKTIEREGLGKNLFYDQRYEMEYNENSEFILNKDPWRKAKIIITRDGGRKASRLDIHSITYIYDTFIKSYTSIANSMYVTMVSDSSKHDWSIDILLQIL